MSKHSHSSKEENTLELIDQLKDENIKLEDQIFMKKEGMSQFDDKLAALLIERDWYLRVLENLSEVVKREPELGKIETILNATPEELAELTHA